MGTWQGKSREEARRLRHLLPLQPATCTRRNEWIASSCLPVCASYVYVRTSMGAEAQRDGSSRGLVGVGAHIGGALRPGTRLQRVHNGHSYGFVLLLVLLSFVFIALAPEDDWSFAVLVMIEAAILSVAIWTSGLVFGRFVIPVVLGVGAIAALAVAVDSRATTRGIVGGIETTFLIASCWVIVAGVWDQGEVNPQSVLGALSIYVSIGILFTVVFSVLAHVGDGPFFAQGTDGGGSTRLYFSFVTLATLGYGDYTAATDLGRMLAVVEALIGQLYLVTVVAVLVANLGRPREPRA